MPEYNDPIAELALAISDDLDYDDIVTLVYMIDVRIDDPKLTRRLHNLTGALVAGLDEEANA